MVISDSRDRLIQNITLLEPQIISDVKNLDILINTISKKTNLRATIIGRDGSVILESDTNKADMQNHSDRLEIIESMKNDYGSIIRYSKTLKTDFIYVAKKITTDEDELYIRLSMSLESAMSHFYHLWTKLLLSFVFLIAVALIIAYNISKKARYDISQITKFLDEISIKNYKATLETKYFHEFLQISTMLKKMVKKLDAKERQKRKHTAKLRLINRQQNDILSAIGHEFKNPIAAIMGYTETLYNDMDIDKKIAKSFLEKILSNTKRLNIMVDRLTMLIKLENNEQPIKPSSFNIMSIIQDSITTLQARYPDRVIRFDGSAQEVFADKTMIELVITNLIDNALKYSQDVVFVSLTDSRITIKDSGIGIADDDIEKIALKFYRTDKNHWDNSMGLGLYIVIYILKLHKSKLIIKSTLGVGSSFEFSIKSMRVKAS